MQKHSTTARRFSAALVAALLLGAGCGTRGGKATDAAGPPTTAPAAAAYAPVGAASASADATPAPSGATGTPAAGTPASPAPAAGGSSAAIASKTVPAPRAAQGTSSGGAASAPAASGGASPSGTPAPGRGEVPAPGPGAAPGPGSAPAAPGACTGDLSPLVIGSVSTMSGVLGESLSGEPKTVQAWAAATNAAGGLRCHKIKYIISDDGGDPNRHASLIQEQVERDKVIAFVYNAAPLSGFASLNYINQHAVPVIGNEGGSPWFYESKYFFPNGASGFDGFSTWFAVPALSPYDSAKKKYAVVSCIEAQACAGIDAKAEQLAKRFNVNLVYKGKASLTQPDFTSHCLRAQQAGAEIVIPVLDGNSVHRFAKSCDSVGYHPLYTGITSATREDFAKNPLLDGYVGGYFELPWFRTDNPLIAEHLQVIKKYAPDVSPGPQSASGWAVAKLFEIAAQNVSEPPTSASILHGLYSIRNNSVGGLLAPVTYTESVPTAPLRDCFWAALIKGGKWGGADKLICPLKQ